MRLVHLADLHLGYRQYHRLTASGLNQREADVAGTFVRALDQVIALEPDVILIAGDVFHVVRPANPVIIHAFSQFARLRDALPKALVVMIGGNHDQPRSTETGCILGLFRQLGFTVVFNAPESLRFPELDLEILAVPDRSGALPSLTPTTPSRYRVLVLHGYLDDVLEQRHESQTLHLTSAELHPDRWTYVALGHHHVQTRVADNAYYSGSLEYTSVNPWRDLQDEKELRLPGKGFLEMDLDQDLARHPPKFHHVASQRRLVDIPPISAVGLSASELMSAIERAVGGVKGGIRDAVARLLIFDTPRGLMRELDPARLRELKQQALFLRIDARPPEAHKVLFSGAPGRRPTLTATVKSYLEERQLDPAVPRADLISLGLHYLDAADVAAEAGAPVDLA
ncbi:MAG: metallophosphoesterase family protein [Gemmatimonadaceae bacterium]